MVRTWNDLVTFVVLSIGAILVVPLLVFLFNEVAERSNDHTRACVVALTQQKLSEPLIVAACHVEIGNRGIQR